MGIKYFFKWFKESFPKTIRQYDEKVNKHPPDPILLMLDLNGIIHTSCQKIYKYGAFEPKCLLKKPPPIYSGDKDLLVFEDVLNNINSLVTLLNPLELVLCIDGVAPISKQIQQRQRRFMSRKTAGGFDSNCISPGTDFLYRLGQHLKTGIELKLEKEWLNTTTIYFMDSLVPGEGEHKLYDFLRSNRARIHDNKFTIIVVGNDADLIMLSLLISTLFLKDNLIYIFREDLTFKKTNYLMININQFKKSLLKFALRKPDYQPPDSEYVVCDFVILCFMVGNDFLPAIPLFNIYDGGLDLMMKYYFTTPGYITFRYSKAKQTSTNGLAKIKINFKHLIGFFSHLLNDINPQAVQHYKTREYGYSNIMLDIAIKKEILFKDATMHYLKAYTLHHKIDQKLVKAYLQVIKWVFNYYAYGSATIDWAMYYPSQFAPSALDLLNYLQRDHTKEPRVPRLNDDKGQCMSEIDPFFQLLCILPPHSADLLPSPFNKVLSDELGHYHPKEIHVDYEGKINEWEGVPILPPLNYAEILSVYNAHTGFCSKDDLKRNTTSKQLMISVVDHPYPSA